MARDEGVHPGLRGVLRQLPEEQGGTTPAVRDPATPTSTRGAVDTHIDGLHRQATYKHRQRQGVRFDMRRGGPAYEDGALHPLRGGDNE